MQRQAYLENRDVRRAAAGRNFDFLYTAAPQHDHVPDATRPYPWTIGGAFPQPARLNVWQGPEPMDVDEPPKKRRRLNDRY